MATGKDYTVEGLGAGDMEWPKDFKLKNSSGTALFSVDSTGVTGMTRVSQTRLISVGAKVGATAGWVVKAADDKNSLARCPASQTASTLVVPLSGFKAGDTITSYYLVGQIESAGNTATLDAALRKQTVAAGDLTDALCTGGAMTQISVTADTAISSANSTKAVTAEVVGADETFYLLLTATTAASTDIDLAGVAVVYTEA